jgi:hypothetical protein
MTADTKSEITFAEERKELQALAAELVRTALAAEIARATEDERNQLAVLKEQLAIAAALAMQRELATEREALAAERKALAAEREILANERAILAAERAGLAAERAFAPRSG